MSAKKSMKVGEKILFGIFGVFIVLATVSYIVLEIVRSQSEEPMFKVRTHYDLSAQGEQGSVFFREARCTSCHRALRNGTNMGLNLDGVGSKRDRDWLYSFLTAPEKTYTARTLDHGATPKEAAYVAKLPDEQLQAIATFLSELRSDQGSASSPVPPPERSAFIDNMLEAWAPESWKEKYQDVREKPGFNSEDDGAAADTTQ